VFAAPQTYDKIVLVRHWSGGFCMKANIFGAVITSVVLALVAITPASAGIPGTTTTVTPTTATSDVQFTLTATVTNTFSSNCTGAVTFQRKNLAGDALANIVCTGGNPATVTATAGSSTATCQTTLSTGTTPTNFIRASYGGGSCTGSNSGDVAFTLATAVPTLREWSLIALMAGLFGFAVWRMSKRSRAFGA